MAEPARPDNIVLIGFMGSGKSTVGRALALRTGRQVADTDDLIEARAGTTISEIFERRGEKAFRDMEAQVAEEVGRLSRAVIVTGGGIVVREGNLAKLKHAGLVFYLAARPEVLYERVKGTTHRPLLKTPDPMAKIRDLLAAREPLYRQADRTVDTSDLDIEAVVDRIVEGAG